MTDGAPSPAPQPDHELHPDDTTAGEPSFYDADLDVGPSLRALKFDGDVEKILREAREMERNPGAWRRPAPGQVEHFDREGYFVDGLGPRVFTIASARAAATGDAIQYLPVLGVDGFIVRGWSHLLAGWWRLGKSELMAATILPWLRLGEKILWITEEPDSIWVDRAAMFDEIYDPVPWDHLVLMDALSAPPNELLEKASNLAEDVVVIDTIREVCGITSMKDDDAVHEAMGPWLRRLRDDHITSIYIAQHRKAAGEQGERVMGSVTLPAKFDVVLELESVNGHERQRRLTARRRRRATAPLIYEMDEDDRIVVVPDGRSRSRVEMETTAVSVVVASEVPLTTAEVRRRMDPKPSADTVQRALTTAAKDGRVVRNPPITEPAERRTVTWCRTTNLPQDLHSLSVEISAADDAAADTSSADTVTRTLPEGMRHSACPRCGSIATVLASAADSLCARCMPLMPIRSRALAASDDWMNR